MTTVIYKHSLYCMVAEACDAYEVYLDHELDEDSFIEFFNSNIAGETVEHGRTHGLLLHNIFFKDKDIVPKVRLDDETPRYRDDKREYIIASEPLYTYLFKVEPIIVNINKEG